MYKQILHKSSVVCKHCEQEGTLIITKVGSSFKKEDRINHRLDCPLRKKKSPKHFIKKRWEKQEELANNLVSAAPTIASGAMFKDGDGRRLFEWRVECKQTKNNSMRLKKSVWVELLFKCKSNGEIPLLHLEINSDKFVCVPYNWKNLGKLNKVKNNNLSISIPNSIKTPIIFDMSYADQNPIDMLVIEERLFKTLNKED